MVKPSRRTGGPKTAEGKLIASRNAVKTGAYSNITVLPGEDLSQFQELEEQFLTDFAPSDLAESSMVRDLTSLTWKKLRLEKLEHLALLRVMGHDVDFKKAGEHFKGTVRNSAEWAFKRIDSIGPAWAKEGQSRKEFANRMQSLDRRKVDLAELERDSPSFHQILMRCARESSVTDLPAFILDGVVKLSDMRKVLFWDYVVGKATSEADDMLWVMENKAKLLAAVQSAKDQRLTHFILGDKVQRVHDDLSRAFYKVLAELRKHQEWRRRRPIDITPEPALPSSNGEPNAGKSSAG